MQMARPFDLNPRIVETLYAEALMLADEVRSAFDDANRSADPLTQAHEDLARVALSCEALRTTTRMMHALAWLLNHRAYFRGELSAFQLRRYGRLHERPAPQGTDGHRAALDTQTRALIVRTERFMDRIERIDAAWRIDHPVKPPAVQRLRERLAATT